jgi:hypothetical protein
MVVAVVVIRAALARERDAGIQAFCEGTGFLLSQD